MSAQAHDGWYAGILGGGNQLKDQTYRIYDYQAPLGIGLAPPEDGTTITEVEFKTGYIGGFTLGYAFGFLRPEIELAYRANDVDKQTEVTFAVTGNTTAEASKKSDSVEGLTAMLNLWIDPLRSGDSSFHPYIGGGAGELRFKFKHPTYGGNDLGSSSDDVFAWQVGAGLGFDVSEHTELALDYRYVRSDEAQFDFSSDSGNVRARYQAQSLMLSLRYFFGGEPEEVPPPPAPEPVVVAPLEEPPPPPPPPPPPCEMPEPGQAVTFEGCKGGDTLVLRGVNFEFDKASLTVNAKSLLDEVAAALNARTDITVEIRGYTDAKGSDGYNQRLSEHRAESVQQYLADKGVDASRMTAKGYGESDPVADNETDEGRELNRRVELKVLDKGGVTAEPANPEADTNQ